MNFKKIFAALAMSVVMVGGASAHVVTTTDHLTTTYTENFNGGTSFVGGTHIDTLFNSDDYLLVSAFAPAATFTFSTALSLAELTLSFWYSVPSDLSGFVALTDVGVAALPDTPQGFLAYLANNPGAGGSGADAFFSATVFDLNPGTYTLSFYSLAGLKIDDLTLTTVAIPEPASLALLGLGLLGFAATRRKAAGRA